MKPQLPEGLQEDLPLLRRDPLRANGRAEGDVHSASGGVIQKLSDILRERRSVALDVHPAHVDEIGELGLRTVHEVVAVAQNDGQFFPRYFKHAGSTVARRGPDTSRDDEIRENAHDKVHDPVAGEVLETLAEAGWVGQVVGHHGLVGGVEGVTCE